MSDSGTRVRRRLPSHPSSAGEARRMVRRLLTDGGREDLVDSAQLLVSEVVTNALVHSGTPIDVSMALADDDGVLVEVGDGSRHLPAPRDYALTASTGRGMALLEQTADAWGVVPGIRGKTVWFQLTAAGASRQGASRATAREENGHGLARVVPLQPAGDAVTVTLLNVPLLLHAAWQQHAEAVLRELLLVRLDDVSDAAGEGSGDPLTVHAAATDALALLCEQIPRPDVGVHPREVMSGAVDPDVSSPSVEVTVPPQSVPNFQTLEALLKRGGELAERGELLVPVIQPELRHLRRWLCRQVLEQQRGVEPVAWPPAWALDHPPLRDPDWDTSTVTTATEPAVAADDTDLIVAVSPGVLDLLGYERDELVGQRLITLIPRRYRQAHLAGFTLHLLTGRGPLLEQAVPVPALRRDGEETMVELRVRAERPARGRYLFVATLRPLDASGG